MSLWNNVFCVNLWTIRDTLFHLIILWFLLIVFIYIYRDRPSGKRSISVSAICLLHAFITHLNVFLVLIDILIFLFFIYFIFPSYLSCTPWHTILTLVSLPFRLRRTDHLTAFIVFISYRLHYTNIYISTLYTYSLYGYSQGLVHHH